jgi:hypothetical protein
MTHASLSFFVSFITLFVAFQTTFFCDIFDSWDNVTGSRFTPWQI